MAKRGSALSKIKVSFKSVKDMTLGQVYGTAPLPITHLSKKIWALIKKKGLRADK